MKNVSVSNVLETIQFLNHIKNHTLVPCKSLLVENYSLLCSEVIEKMMLGLYKPHIIIHKTKHHCKIIFDNSLVQGILDFIENKFPIQNSKHGFNNLYYKDLDFQQKRCFLTSEIIVTEYLENLNSITTCDFYRYVNQTNQKAIPHFNQRIRELYFSGGSKILSDVTFFFKEKVYLYNDKQSSFEQNNLTLALLLIFYKHKNHEIFNKVNDNDSMILSKDNLLFYLENELSFLNPNDVIQYIEKHSILDFITNETNYGVELQQFINDNF